MSTRHRWIKLAIHNYLCAKCGTVKVNEQIGEREYRQRYHVPDGTQKVLRHVPLCEPGPQTKVRLDFYLAHASMMELPAAHEPPVEPPRVPPVTIAPDDECPF
jgi:hypothetical protein